MYDHHEEYSGTVIGSVERVFEHLDDQTRLSAHMNKRSWKMGWGKMDVRLDAQSGQVIGSHIVLDGRVFGVRIFLDEVVTERNPPMRKQWETVGEPRLLVIGRYRMRFDLTPAAGNTVIRVAIDYELPRRGFSRLLGVLFGRSYAQWCTRQMVLDARATRSA
jgi:hypothetical protein